MLYVAEERTAGGRLFHALGPATAYCYSTIIMVNKGFHLFLQCNFMRTLRAIGDASMSVTGKKRK